MANITRGARLVVSTLMGLLVAGVVDLAGAAEPIEVRAGESAVVARTTQPITNEKADRGSVVKVMQGTGPTATNVLVYLPPSGVTNVDDVVQYAVDGKPVTMPVAVRPPAPTLTDREFYSNSFKALFALFILAVLVENGLALISRWRPFLDYFDSRTVNAVAAFAFSLLFVWLFKLDIATTLVNTYSGAQHLVNWPGMLLTALIIAGGSAGVNRILQALATFRCEMEGARPVFSQRRCAESGRNEHFFVDGDSKSARW